MIVGGVLAVAAFAMPASFVPGVVGYIGLGIISAPGALTYVVAVREMAPAIRAPVFALVQVVLMGGQATVAVLAGSLADSTSVGTSIALWQLPTIAISMWVLAAALGAYLVQVVVRAKQAATSRPTPDAPRPVVEAPRSPAPSPTPRASRPPRVRERPVLPTKN